MSVGCKHYNSKVSNHEECDAGINVREMVGGADVGWIRRTPCLIMNDGLETVPCSSYAEPSEADVKEEEEAFDLLIERMKVISPFIGSVKEQHKGTNWSGVKTCPVCDDDIVVTHAASNGHISLRCSTEDCVNLIE